MKELSTGRIEITSQNHSYAVDAQSLENTPLMATHINILDNTIEGVACPEMRAFSVQYHPESAPGPQDSGYLFDRFVKLMKTGELDLSERFEKKINNPDEEAAEGMSAENVAGNTMSGKGV